MSTSVSDLIELEAINKNIRVLEPDMTYYDDMGSWVLIYTGNNNYIKISELVELAFPLMNYYQILKKNAFLLVIQFIQMILFNKWGD